MRTLQLKRFDRVFSAREDAIRNINLQSTNLKDGEPIVASYYKNQTEIAYVIGLKVEKEGGVSSMFTMDAAGLEEKIESLSGTIPQFTSGTSGNGSVSFDSGSKTLTLTWKENNIDKSASTTINAESYVFASAATENQNVVFTTGSGQGGSIQISANVDTIDCGEYTGTDRS